MRHLGENGAVFKVIGYRSPYKRPLVPGVRRDDDEWERRYRIRQPIGLEDEAVEKFPAVYIMASKKNGTLYTGVTSDLVGRVWEHKNNVFKGFSRRHNIKLLAWYEFHQTMPDAIEREKNIKEWKRLWKVKLIDEFNPQWNDLYEHLLEDR